jgi:hypothetical protein
VGFHRNFLRQLGDVGQEKRRTIELEANKPRFCQWGDANSGRKNLRGSVIFGNFVRGTVEGLRLASAKSLPVFGQN